MSKALFAQLKSLSGDLDPIEALAMINDSASRQDLGLVIRGCGAVEDGLETRLEDHLIEMNSDRRSRVFGDRGPLGRFSDRILMARVLGLIDEAEFDRLTALRHLRNAFAHARVGMTFDQPVVRRVVEKILVLRTRPAHLRLDFAVSCGVMAVRISQGSEEAGWLFANDIAQGHRNHGDGEPTP